MRELEQIGGLQHCRGGGEEAHKVKEEATRSVLCESVLSNCAPTKGTRKGQHYMSQKILFKGIVWHSSGWVVFYNGKLAKPCCGMAYHRSPLLIMVYFQKAPWMTLRCAHILMPHTFQIKILELFIRYNVSDGRPWGLGDHLRSHAMTAPMT